MQKSNVDTNNSQTKANPYNKENKPSIIWSCLKSRPTQITENQPPKGCQTQQTHNYRLYGKIRLLVSQPHRYLVTHIVLFLSMAYFYVFTYCVNNTYKNLNIPIIIFHSIVTILLLVLGLKNPGIYPKITIMIPFDIECRPAINQEPKSYVFSIKSHSINVKLCRQCLIYKSPRTVHCGTCNCCVEKMDHHCSFIGNCVGKGNYQFFIIFIISLNILLILVMVQIISFIVKQILQPQNSIVTLPFAVILLIFAFLVELFVGALTGFHTMLISSNQTTNQFCHNRWDNISGNPFSKNLFIKNLLTFIKGSQQLVSSGQVSKTMNERKKQQDLKTISSSMQNNSQKQYSEDRIEQNNQTGSNFKKNNKKAQI